MTSGVENSVAPTSCDGSNYIWFTKDFVSDPIRVEHDDSEVAQDIGDQAFATRNAADKTEDEHGPGARSQGPGASYSHAAQLGPT